MKNKHLQVFPILLKVGVDLTTTIFLPRIILKFDFSADQSIYSFWKWKIDPWTSGSKPIEEKDDYPVITVKYDPEVSSVNNKSILLNSQRDGFFEHRIWLQTDGSMLFELYRTKKELSELVFYINSECSSIVLLNDLTHTGNIAAFEYMSHFIPFIFLQQSLLSLHAAVIEYDNWAIAICAPAGTGKTTHARLWRKYNNALVLNGDRMVCGIEQDEWLAFGTPWSGTSGEQLNRVVPLKAVVVLERSENNCVQKMLSVEGFHKLYPHVLIPTWNKQLTIKAIDLLDKLLARIPIFLLKCRPDKEAVEMLHDSIWNT